MINVTENKKNYNLLNMKYKNLKKQKVFFTELTKIKS